MEGSQQAFERFVEVYRTKLFQYSYAMCGQREDAEEVAQETLLEVFRKLHQLRQPERLKAWVFRIAKNACLMKRRRSVFAPAAELSLDELRPARSGQGEPFTLDIADWSQLPDSELWERELHTVLERAIQDLPDIYRAVVLLRDVEELSTEDAAAVLDVSVDVVKTRLHRARLALRRALDTYLRTGRSAPAA